MASSPPSSEPRTSLPPPSQPPPPSDLIDDVIAEILLRLPPEEPEHLFRAAVVCKPWLRVSCDPAFLRRYRAYHGAPPLLGFLDRMLVPGGHAAPRFASITSTPDFPLPKGSDGRWAQPLDCRHGRVLLLFFHEDGNGADLLVWNPVTGDRRGVPGPGITWLPLNAAVFCATDGCDHLDCHDGPFRVAFLASDATSDIIWVLGYSSETGAWSTPVSLDHECYIKTGRGAVVRDEFYFIIWPNASVVKYDWGKNNLSLLKPPLPSTYCGRAALMTMMDGSLGFAVIKDFSLHLWWRKVNSVAAAKWVLCRVIKLEAVMPMANPIDEARVVGFAEGVGAIFISTDVGLFMIELKSGRVRKVDEPEFYFVVLPYMNFYTPDRGTLLSLARTL